MVNDSSKESPGKSTGSTGATGATGAKVKRQNAQVKREQEDKWQTWNQDPQVVKQEQKCQRRLSRTDCSLPREK